MGSSKHLQQRPRDHLCHGLAVYGEAVSPGTPGQTAWPSPSVLELCGACWPVPSCHRSEHSLTWGGGRDPISLAPSPNNTQGLGLHPNATQSCCLNKTRRKNRKSVENLPGCRGYPRVNTSDFCHTPLRLASQHGLHAEFGITSVCVLIL